MKNRKPANSRREKKRFTRTASGANKKNFPRTIMRGGYRL